MSLRFLLLAGAVAVSCGGCDASLPASNLPSSDAARPSNDATDAAGAPASIYRGTMIQLDNGVPARVSVEQTVTVSASPYPYGSEPDALDYHSVEIDRHGSHASSWRGDAWRGYGTPSAGSAPFLSYGSRIANSDGDSLLYRYPVAQRLDERPERNGAAWSNGATLDYGERDADGTTIGATYAASGAYDETVNYARCAYSQPCTLYGVVKAGGGARYTGTALAASGIDAIALGSPSHGTIDVTYTYAGGYRQSERIAAWFGAGALYTESDSIRTGVAFPSSCALAPAYGTHGNVVVRTISQTDPAAGTSETELQQSYATPAGTNVCTAFSETLTAYYDYSSGTFGATPLQTRSVNETLSLRSSGDAGHRTPDAAAAAERARVELRWRSHRIAAMAGSLPHLAGRR